MMTIAGRPPRLINSPSFPSCVRIPCAWKSVRWGSSKVTGSNRPPGKGRPTMEMEKLVALCRRRGLIFQSSEIYGGINGFWDYGPLGVELKRNIKEAWWHDMVHNPPLGPDGREIQIVGVDCALIMNPKVWQASGHATGFQDPMQTCRQCKKLFRAD